MAILLDYQKTHEDARRVEYRFGYPEPTRSLVIDPATLTGRPVDGTADRDYAAVLASILRRRREAGTWPAGGTYAA